MAYDFPASPVVNQGFQGWVYDGEKWVLKPGGGMIRRYAYVATASQTVFSGADVNGQTLAYTPSALEVIVNGVTLPQADFTATNGTSVTVGIALNVGDYVYIQAFESFPVTDAISMNWSQTLTGLQVSQTAKNIGLPFMFQGYINGLVLSTAGSSSTFSVALGSCIDDSRTDWMGIGSSLAKTTGSWAVGTTNGALDTGSIANNTWYHVFLIKRPDTAVVDVLISTSVSSPTMPSNYTLKRRIGSIRTNGSAQWTKFVQLGDNFVWDIAVLDVNAAAPGVNTAQTASLTVPTGFQVDALINFQCVSGAGNDTRVYISPFDKSDEAAGVANVTGGSTVPAAGVGTAGNVVVRTNGSGQIRWRFVSANSTMYISTYGWTDQRGKNL